MKICIIEAIRSEERVAECDRESRAHDTYSAGPFPARSAGSGGARGSTVAGPACHASATRATSCAVSVAPFRSVPLAIATESKMAPVCLRISPRRI